MSYIYYSGRDHTSAAAAAAASLPTKRTHKMMDAKSTNSESVCTNTTTLFASGMERLKAAQIELTLAQKNMESIRQQIRNSGDVEPDSLLCLCDKEDNYILSYIMNYLAVDDLGRCELVCITLRKQAKKFSDKLNEVRITNYTGKEPVPKDVTFVGLHPSVIEICEEAFKDCRKLRHVVLNEGLVSIRKDAFRNCTSLASIKFPSTLIEIADCAFKSCSNLKKVVLNDGLQKLGDKAFGKCTSLKSIDLPPTLTLLGHYVLDDCVNLTEVVFNEERKGRKIGQLKVPEHLKDQYEMQQYDYDGERVSYSNLNEVVFHEEGGGLGCIEKGMFCDCKSLERIKLPSTIKGIGEDAFYGCVWLKDVVLNEECWRIDSQAFHGCMSLESMTLPPASKFFMFEGSVFFYCQRLKNVLLSDGLKKKNEDGSEYWSTLKHIRRRFCEKMSKAFARGCPVLESFKFPYISARLERMVYTGHADIESKIDEVRGLVEWKSNELLVSVESMTEKTNWNSLEESLNKIVDLLVFHEVKESTTLFELALWKSKIDQTEKGTNPVDRAACRTEVPRRVKNTILQYLF